LSVSVISAPMIACISSALAAMANCMAPARLSWSVSASAR
jgi:hypothetical protein